MAGITIAENSKVTLGLLISILAGVLLIATFLFRLDARVSNLEKAIPAAWTVQDQVVWALYMKRDNPTLIMSDPNYISEARKKSGER